MNQFWDPLVLGKALNDVRGKALSMGESKDEGGLNLLEYILFAN